MTLAYLSQNNHSKVGEKERLRPTISCLYENQYRNVASRTTATREETFVLTIASEERSLDRFPPSCEWF